jgi:hypothetical protein
MELKLLSGTFSSDDAKQLLTRLINVKIDFHAGKIDTRVDNEEDMKSSEKRILELERSLRQALDLVESGAYSQFAINAKVVVEFCPRYESA